MIFGMARNSSARSNFARLFPDASAPKRYATRSKNPLQKRIKRNGTFLANYSSDQQKRFRSWNGTKLGTGTLNRHGQTRS